MSEFTKVGAGWKTKKGTGYNCVLSVDLPKGQRFLIFKNKQKQADKHPDIVLGYFEDDGERQQERDKWDNSPASEVDPASITEDQIPF